MYQSRKNHTSNGGAKRGESRSPRIAAGVALGLGIALGAIVPAQAQNQTDPHGVVSKAAGKQGPVTVPAPHVYKPPPNEIYLGPVTTAINKYYSIQHKLANDGIDVHFGYLNEFGHNMQGGTRTTSTYADEIRFGANFDLQKLVGWNGGKLVTWFTNRNGNSLTQEAGLSNFEELTEIAGRGHITRVTKFYLQQQLYFLPGAFGKSFIKLGLMGPDEDFDTMSCNFITLTFCGSQVGDMIGDTVFDYPVSQPAAVLHLNFTKNAYFAAGAYAVQPDRLKYGQAANFALAGPTTGGYFPVEIGFHVDIGPKNLPGDYQIGGWYENATYNSAVYDANGVPFLISGLPPARERGDGGIFLWGSQQLTERNGDPSRGLFVEGNVVLLNNNRANASSSQQIMLFYHGPFDSRPHDLAGIAFGRFTPDSGVQAAQQQFNYLNPNAPIAVRNRNEYDFDVMYQLHVLQKPNFYIEPEITYIVNPGGFSNTEKGRSIWAFQFRSSIMF